MLEKLCPRYRAESIFALEPETLRAQGIKGLILDLDNTLVEWGSEIVPAELVAWVDRFKKAGFKLCIVSNAVPQRVEAVAETLGIPGLPQATKPFKTSFKRALAILGTAPEETAVIGDQLFTDILGGNRMDLYTIWTPPLSETEFLSTRAVRRLERLVVKRFRKRGLWG
ncbi:MAG: YqeG family HAD IIIA-type phosphatase [Firmicutes bacterium]|nr:YqeG family HAD IIIA-type phosphatase [Bacillota bacterium]